jgi:flagella basal body P-ring formation protein FlgA
MKKILRIKWIVVTGMFFLLSSWNCSSASAKTTVRVLEHAQVKSKLIRLGEISEIKGEDTLLSEKLKAIVLGKAPQPGETKSISAQYIKSKVRQNGIDSTAIIFNLPEKTGVVREAVVISPEKAEKIIRQFILKKMPWDPQETSINVRAVKAITLAAGKVTCEVIPRRNEKYLGKTNLSLVFAVDGKVEKKLWISARIDVSKEVVLCSRPMERHYVITKDDVRLEKMSLAGLPHDVITDPLEVIGKRTKRVIDAGSIFRYNFLEVLPLVKRGDMVTIVAESEVVKITTQGVVTEKGCKGEMVRVINTGSRKEIFARVRDARTVEVEF